MNMDRIDLIQTLFAAFPNATATDSVITAYLEVLQDIPLDELAIVIKQCMRDGGSFPPSAGQVLKAWLATSRPIRGGAEEGWLSVQNAMRDPANYTPDPSPFVPIFRDSIVTKVVKAMGWWNLRMSTEPRIDQSQFTRMYNAFAEREERDYQLLPEYKLLYSEENSGRQIETQKLIADLAGSMSSRKAETA